jgi:broad specificity phosphatase PhoE
MAAIIAASGPHYGAGAATKRGALTPMLYNRGMSTNTLYLVRHGENPANLTREFSHRLVDYSLTPRGVEQATETAEHFARLPIAAVYSSPLKRAFETAAIIAARLEQPVTVCEEFREVNVGDFEGQPPTDALWAEHDRIFEAWFAGARDLSFPGGENMHSLHERVRRGIGATVEGRDGQQIVIVCHGGLLLASVADLCPEVDVLPLVNLPIPNCAIVTMEMIAQPAPDGPSLHGRLISWAATDHLDVASTGRTIQKW